MNDDTIASQSGFPAHSHRDVEIIIISLKGELTHKDNIGNTSTLNESMMQIMSLGSGITPAEWNTPRHFLILLFQM